MNIGIVGYGKMGKKWGEAISQIPETLFFGAIDKDNDVFNLIEHPLVDVIIIATPNHVKYDIVTKAFADGKHVLCEKPMGFNLHEALEIHGRFTKKGVNNLFCSGFNYRFYPGIWKLKEIIDSCKYGKVNNVRITFTHAGRPNMLKEWRFDPKQGGGGVIMDMGVHIFDLCSYLFKANLIDSCKIDRYPETSAWITCKYPYISVYLSAIEGKNVFRIEVQFEGGYVYLEGKSGFYGRQTLVESEKYSWTENIIKFPDEENSFRDELAEFISKIKTGSESKIRTSDTFDGLHAMQMVDECYKRINVGI